MALEGRNVDGGDIAAVAAQIGSSLLPDNDQWMNRFKVKSTSSSAFYTIAQRRSDKVWGCSCVGWRHHRRCRHVDDVLSRLSKVSTAGIKSVDVIEMLANAALVYLDFEPTKKVTALKVRGRVLDFE